MGILSGRLKRAWEAAKEPTPVEEARREKRGPCPRCAAPADRRIEACGFGPDRPIICGQCGYEFEVRNVGQ